MAYQSSWRVALYTRLVSPISSVRSIRYVTEGNCAGISASLLLGGGGDGGAGHRVVDDEDVQHAGDDGEHPRQLQALVAGVVDGVDAGRRRLALEGAEERVGELPLLLGRLLEL